jgi:hypothetical protein
MLQQGTDTTEYPKFINPIEAGEVEGTVTGLDKAPTKFGQAMIVNLAVDGEERALWLTQTVLRSQFGQLKPKVGEKIRVEYLGMRDGAGGEYHNFRVTAPDRPPFVPDWDALAGEAGYEDENPFPPEVT